MRQIKEIGYAGRQSQEETKAEREHRALSAKAAAEGMVLLQNKGMLPLKKRKSIALFGPGARHTVTGGTGSGDVNERYSVTIEEGLKNAGFTISTSKWLDSYDQMEETNKRSHYEAIYDKAGKRQLEKDISLDHALLQVYTQTPAYIPSPGEIPTEEDISEADGQIAVYVLVRNAGESKDREKGSGDYQLAQAETDSIYFLKRHFKQVLVIINCGGVMDLSLMDHCDVDALLVINQPGMEAGSALTKIITGEITPSGKLTDTWPKHYEDYPNSETFSYNSGDISKEHYLEGIYVGYRYFDKARITPRYAFGYGLSYTTFDINNPKVTVKGNQAFVTVKVINTGDRYSGKEVIQIYISLPQGRLPKEEKRLVAFTKTKLLAPGEGQQLTLSFEISSCTSFDEAQVSYILESGSYGIMIGNASDAVSEIAYLETTDEIIVQKTAFVCPQKEAMNEIILPENERKIDSTLPVFIIEAEAVKKPNTEDVVCHELYSEYTIQESDVEKEILDQMTGEQMAVLVCGTPSGVHKTMIGLSAVTVVGAAGETTSDYSKEPWNLANIVLADGPAGLRLMKKYQLDPNGAPYPLSVLEKFIGSTDHQEGTDYYQYCTRIPSGTLLAQTFDLELLEEIGRMIAEEMEEFHITLWLAPGMNIHRNPLCGRNFEYYSEDPYVTGKMGAAITKGVQSRSGVGTTIKHFACNNQEDNRMHCDSIVSQRALREIYLKGFEIAVKESQPLAVMSSYNLVNGIHTANSYDLLTNVLRREWEYQGMVMTDWNTTGEGGSSADLCMRAGNDMIMPGSHRDINEIINGLQDEAEDSLLYRELRNCAARIVRTILQSNRYR